MNGRFIITQMTTAMSAIALTYWNMVPLDHFSAGDGFAIPISIFGS